MRYETHMKLEQGTEPLEVTMTNDDAQTRELIDQINSLAADEGTDEQYCQRASELVREHDALLVAGVVEAAVRQLHSYPGAEEDRRAIRALTPANAQAVVERKLDERDQQWTDTLFGGPQPAMKPNEAARLARIKLAEARTEGMLAEHLRECNRCILALAGHPRDCERRAQLAAEKAKLCGKS